MTAPNKSQLKIIAALSLLLLIPFVAMQVTNEVQWDAPDFFLMATMLLIAGVAGELTRQKIRKKKYLLVAIVVIVGVFLLVWGELATGYIRSAFTAVSSTGNSLLQPSFLNL